MHLRERCAARSASDIRSQLLMSAFFALATAVASKVAFHLWYTPVPVTLQVLGVILSGIVLGSRLGAASQIMYLAMGMAGLPVFAGMQAGPAVFAGPTGGYLVGFVFGAYAAGWVFERLSGRTQFAAWIAGVAGIAALYAVGAPWLGLWLGCTGVKPWSTFARSSWQLGVMPFVGVDILKALAASSIAVGGRSGSGLLRVFRNTGC